MIDFTGYFGVVVVELKPLEIFGIGLDIIFERVVDFDGREFGRRFRKNNWLLLNFVLENLVFVWVSLKGLHFLKRWLCFVS